MELTVRSTDVTLSEPIVLLNSDDCLEMGVSATDRVRITGGCSALSAVVISDTVAPEGTVSMAPMYMERYGTREGERVRVEYATMPESVRSIRRKINGRRLGYEEIRSIVDDVQEGSLSQKEILAFVSAFNVNNSDITEIAYLTRAMAATGRTVDLGVRPVFDFHSLGGVPGNHVTPIVVSIVASEGLVIPKLSSRAVSSACGSADFENVFCDVEMDAETLGRTVRRTMGVFACGNDDYAPVGSTIIDAERPLGIDPRPTMMASIMSKKVALGTTHLLVDIPTGVGTKVPDLDAARSFAADLIDLGTVLGIHVECAATCGGQPVGSTIGPVLEARECIAALEGGDADPALVDKACSLAGIILEMGGARDGRERAQEILRSGRAHEKFLEIVEAQNGSRSLRSSDLVPGSFSRDVHSGYAGVVQYVDNHSMTAIAKAAGSPSDPGAGVELLHKAGDEVSAGDVLFRIYAENQAKLDRAVETARSRRPMAVSSKAAVRMPPESVLERIPAKAMLDLIRFRHGARSSYRYVSHTVPFGDDHGFHRSGEEEVQRQEVLRRAGFAGDARQDHRGRYGSSDCQEPAAGQDIRHQERRGPGEGGFAHAVQVRSAGGAAVHDGSRRDVAESAPGGHILRAGGCKHRCDAYDAGGGRHRSGVPVDKLLRELRCGEGVRNPCG